MMIAFISSYAGISYPEDLYFCVYPVAPVYKENPDVPTPNRRTPSAPLLGVISQESGVEFLTIQKPEISYYQIEDEDGNVYNYGDELSFIDALFSMSGEVSILMASENCNYIGYVEL